MFCYPALYKLRAVCTIRYSIDSCYVFLSYFLQARGCVYNKVSNKEFQCLLILFFAGYDGSGCGGVDHVVARL